MSTNVYGLKVEIELKRDFREEKQALKAWNTLKGLAAHAERVSAEAYDTHGLRRQHFNEAHEIFDESGNGTAWKVKSWWFVLLAPKKWKGGKEEAQKCVDGLVEDTRKAAAAKGFTEAEVTGRVVPEEDWQ